MVNYHSPEAAARFAAEVNSPPSPLVDERTGLLLAAARDGALPDGVTVAVPAYATDDDTQRKLLDDATGYSVSVLEGQVQRSDDSDDAADTNFARRSAGRDDDTAGGVTFVTVANGTVVRDAPQLPVRRTAIFTMLPLFMGYATLVTLQGEVKTRIGIPDGKNAMSYEFSFATSFLYLGNLIFRLMHNVVFSMFSPRIRVCIAYVAMFFAVGILGLYYFILDGKSLAPVFIAYSLGGVAVGTFESNLISSITPLGHATKAWAQYGITFGFNGISIGAFLLFTAFPSLLALRTAVYSFVMLANICGLVFYWFAIPHLAFECSKQSLRTFWEDLKSVPKWGLLILPYALCLLVDMFALGCFSALQIYIYDVPEIPLWYHSTARIPEEAFRAVFNLCAMIGDGSGRKLAYSLKRLIHPAFYLIATFIGAGMILSKIALLAPFGQFLVMFANGAIYATSTKHIDVLVDKRFNLIALSVWLFLGDVGSFSGANAVNALRVAVGSVASYA